MILVLERVVFGTVFEIFQRSFRQVHLLHMCMYTQIHARVFDRGPSHRQPWIVWNMGTFDVGWMSCKWRRSWSDMCHVVPVVLVGWSGTHVSVYQGKLSLGKYKLPQFCLSCATLSHGLPSYRSVFLCCNLRLLAFVGTAIRTCHELPTESKAQINFVPPCVNESAPKSESKTLNIWVSLDTRNISCVLGLTLCHCYCLPRKSLPNDCWLRIIGRVLVVKLRVSATSGTGTVDLEFAFPPNTRLPYST